MENLVPSKKKFKKELKKKLKNCDIVKKDEEFHATARV